ncbi:ADP-ribosylation factor GTPase-activating protein AGD12 [Ananas comosus]|uniref:ADP-ribosylation factor GTPase-activating protein AGD12 n=1 Tax=Ananas comosus TaxID=4615 RepID=A0A199VE58_ANACO|nr:ADP-ribosylation factor GTPase-activating protein AGD12 [Ananas comosus]
MSSRYLTGKARKLKELTLKSDNRICADCGAPDPKWASANIGVFLCLKCSDIHRSLGPDVSKVLSVTLDEWSDGDIDSMVEVGGNSYANSIYEAFLPKRYPKPKADSSYEDRSNFIRSKYELQEFLKPSLRIVSSKMSFRSFDSMKSSDSSFVSDTSKKDKVQTTVKKSNLNPVWNEVLKFSVPQHYGPLKLEVYDHDVFTADDIMGEAEIDLQPMITAAMPSETLASGNMQIGSGSRPVTTRLLKIAQSK